MMTQTFTNEAFAALGAPHLVYIRPVLAADVIAGVPAEALKEAHVEPGQTLYALHGADGARLAVLTDRDAAYAAAFANQLAPVAVH